LQEDQKLEHDGSSSSDSAAAEKNYCGRSQDIPVRRTDGEEENPAP
jgi:hypothetical protein